MKVLANDGLEAQGIHLFEQAEIEIDVNKKEPEDLVQTIGEYDGLIVRSRTKVTSDVIEAGKSRLKIIGRAGVGYDNIDVDAASKNGIVVKFAPHGNTNSTAELALTLMMSVSRNIPQAHVSLKNSVWKKKPFRGSELSGKVLGIIGCGRIGQRLAQLVRGFDMKVIGYDLFPRSDSRIEYMSMEEVLAKADYISIHAGGTTELIGGKEFKLIKPSAFLINASRGVNVNEEALYQALKDRAIAGAGLDTYIDEPKTEGQEFNKKFKELDNVVLSSHLGASTNEAQEKTGIEVAEVVIGFLKTGNWRNAVNVGEEVDVQEKPTWPVFIYHRDKPGVFAHLDNIFAEHNINIREISGRKFADRETAAAVYMVEGKPEEELLAALEAIPDVFCVKR